MPHISPLDVNETGRVLAQLDDVRAIFLVLIIVIVLLMGVVIWLFRSVMGSMTRGVEKLATSIDGMTHASTERLTADLVHNARVEAVMTRADATLARLEHRLEKEAADAAS